MLKTISISFSTLLLVFLYGCKSTGFKANKHNYSQQKNLSEPSALKQFNLNYLALGKNRIEVENLMGAPEGRTLGQNGEYLWDYRRPVIDDESGKVYDWSLITFHFNKGKCSFINFTLSNKPVQLLEEHQSALAD
jgi:hypothetical protein